MIVDQIRLNNEIAFIYARKTKSGFKGRAGRVVEVRPHHIVIEETIAPTLTQFRCFHKSAMLNIEFLS